MQSSVELEPDETEETEGSTTDGRRSGVRRRLARLFSIRAFLIAVAATLAGVVVGGFVGGLIPLLGTVGRILGIVGATFLLGLVRSRRQYTEVIVAGAVVAVLAVLSSSLTGAFLPVGVEVLQEYGIALTGVGAGSGAAASLLGYYFGRDLRDGLTRPV